MFESEHREYIFVWELSININFYGLPSDVRIRTWGKFHLKYIGGESAMFESEHGENST